MPEQNQPINTLPIETASGITATDYILGISSAEEYQMLIQDLGDYIIQNVLSSLAGQSQTLANAIDTLSRKIVQEVTTLASTYGTLTYKCYKINDHIVGVIAQLNTNANIPASGYVITGLPYTGTSTNYSPVLAHDNNSHDYYTFEIRREGTTECRLYTRTGVDSGKSLRMNFVYTIE